MSVNLPLTHATSDLSNATYRSGEDQITYLNSALSNVQEALAQALKEKAAADKEKAKNA